MREAHIICPAGQTSLKKARFRVLFSECATTRCGARKTYVLDGARTRFSTAAVTAAPLHPPPAAQNRTGRKRPIRFVDSASIKQGYAKRTLVLWRRHPESDRGIKVLQTSALPLGYGAEIK